MKKTIRYIGYILTLSLVLILYTPVTYAQTVDISTEGMNVKVGLKDQVGGKIVLVETEKGMLKADKEIIIDIVDGQENGIRLVDAKVEAINLKLEETQVKDGRIKLTVSNSSDKAGMIILSDITVDVTGVAPEGQFSIRIGGTAISNLNETGTDDMADFIEIDNFLTVITPNVEDQGSKSGLRKGTAKFKIGSKKYTINGIERKMDAALYLSTNKVTMMPLRYVAQAFGITDDQIVLSTEEKGTVILIAGDKVLELKDGSNEVNVNGITTEMSEKIVTKAGRMYIPVGEIGRLLGIQVEWSNKEQTVTFTNK